MEKLQAALDKARRERQGKAPVADAPAGQPGVKPGGIEALWSGLAPFDVSPKVLEQHRVVTRDAGPSAAPFDILRTKILVQMRKQGWKRLAITSPMPSNICLIRCGKSSPFVRTQPEAI